MPPLQSTLVLAACVALSACSTTNTAETKDTANTTASESSAVSRAAEQIKPGETTKAEVRALFGEPDVSTTDSSGIDIWNYNDSKSLDKHLGTARGALAIVGATGVVPYLGLFNTVAGLAMRGRKDEQIRETLIITFAPNDIVENVQVTRSR